MKTLAAMVEDCRNLSGFNDTNYDYKWKSFLNDALAEYARAQPWDGLEDTMDVVTTGSHILYLPHFVDTVIGIFNKNRNAAVTREGDWERSVPYPYGNRTAGAVLGYDKFGIVPTIGDPTGYVYFQSTHASDVDFTVFVSGYVANSGASGTALAKAIQTLSLTTTGTSPVTITSLFTKILSISKSTDTNGDFFFYDAGDSNSHLSEIPASETVARFIRLQLLYAPSEQTTLEIRFRHKVPELKNDAQSPPPCVNCDFLVERAIAAHFEEQQQYAKAQMKSRSATEVLQSVSHKDQNFNEPYSQIVPSLYNDDPYADEN